MDRQEFLNTLTEIGTCENEVERREKLSSLHDEVEKLYTDNETLTTQNKTLTDDNETLRSANMKLFLRVGEQKTEAQIKKDTTGIEAKPETKRNFSDLFDDKGGLK